MNQKLASESIFQGKMLHSSLSANKNWSICIDLGMFFGQLKSSLGFGSRLGSQLHHYFDVALSAGLNAHSSQGSRATE